MGLVLNPTIKSALGDDTFWCWAERVLGGEFRTPTKDDTVLQYSLRGHPPACKRAIGLLWELDIEMQRVLGEKRTDQIRRIRLCAEGCDINVVPTELVASLYPEYKPQVVPIGVDMELFSPMPLADVRAKHGITLSDTVGIWVGTDHPMKGFDLIDWELADSWIIVWKSQPRRVKIGRQAKTFTRVDQRTLAELMNCADFYCVSGRLRPYFLVEYEAMACNRPLVITGETHKDFDAGEQPRQTLIDRGWDRKDVKQRWLELIEN